MKPPSAKQIEKLTVEYEAFLNKARELLKQLPDEPQARALGAYILLMHGDLHRLHKQISEKEQQA